MTPSPLQPTREQELFRLLELKLIPDHLRTHKQQMEMDKLHHLHKAYAKLSASELKKKLQSQLDLIVLAIQSPGNSALLSQDYQTTFAHKPGHPKPLQKSGMIALVFKCETDAVDFLFSQASKGRKFKVLNAEHRLIALSNGKGALQHADGRPFNRGNAFAPLPNILQNRPQARAPVPAQKPNMIAPRRPPLANPQVVPLVPTPFTRPVMTPVLDVKRKSPYPTPFKKHPYDY